MMRNISNSPAQVYQQKEFNRETLKKKLNLHLISSQTSESVSPKISKANKNLPNNKKSVGCFQSILGKRKNEAERIEKKVKRAQTNLKKQPKAPLSKDLIVQLHHEDFEPFNEMNEKARKETIAASALESKLHKELDLIQLDQELALKPWGWDSANNCMGEINSINPTSAINDPTIAESKHLVNCYTTLTKDRVLVRSGVIDTDEKALDWLQVCVHEHQKLVQKNPKLEDKPFRIVSHQLNSPETEGKMIDNQHRAMLALNKENEHGAEIVHINTPLNRFYHFTKLLRKFGFIGRKLENLLFSGEKKSHQQNIEGLGTYATWVTQDITPFAKQYKDMTIENVLNQYFDTEIKKETAELNHLRKSTKALKFLAEKSQNPILEKEMRIATLEMQKDFALAEILIRVNSDTEDLRRAQQDNLVELQNKYLREGFKFDEKAFYSEVNIVIDKVVAKTKIVQKMSDLERKMTSIKEQQEKISNKVLELGKQADKKTRKTMEKELHGLRNTLKKTLKEEHQTLAEMKNLIQDNQLENDSPELHKAYQTIVLFHSFLGAQLELTNNKVNRGQEIMILELLNQRLGVVSAKNCKSGLDRTALEDALEKMIEQIETEYATKAQNSDLLFEIVMDWNQLSRQINRQMTTRKDFLNFINWLEEPAITEKEVKIKTRFRLICHMRNRVLKNLIESGIPITSRSTGVEGLKWHREWYQENLLPQNFLPPFVFVQKNEGTEPELIKLLNFSYRTGRSTGLTDAGHQLLTRDSPNRGA